MMNISENQVYTLTELAANLNKAYSTISRWPQRGLIVSKIGGDTYVLGSDILDFIKSKRSTNKYIEMLNKPIGYKVE